MKVSITVEAEVPDRVAEIAQLRHFDELRLQIGSPGTVTFGINDGPMRSFRTDPVTRLDITVGSDIQATVTDRGFQWMPTLQDINGGQVTVFESSMATQPAIRLKVRDQLGSSEAMLHLDAETAWTLKRQLEWLLEHHYQGDARPETATPVTSADSQE